MNYQTATNALLSINRSALTNYHTYFDNIKPSTPDEIFKRGLFAFSSVHTTWKKNVDLFALLWDLEWMKSFEDLRSRIEQSGAGLTNNRAKYIWQFSKQYWLDPNLYLKSNRETWPEYRDRIEGMTLGLGHAKTSFFLEMIYFQDAKVVCGDTHQLQLYGLKGNASPNRRTMDYIERHWVEECTKMDLPPVTARWYLWDRKQKKTDSRYWSYVLEGEKPELTLPRQLEMFNLSELRRAA